MSIAQFVAQLSVKSLSNFHEPTLNCYYQWLTLISAWEFRHVVYKLSPLMNWLWTELLSMDWAPVVCVMLLGYLVSASQRFSLMSPGQFGPTAWVPQKIYPGTVVRGRNSLRLWLLARLPWTSEVGWRWTCVGVALPTLDSLWIWAKKMSLPNSTRMRRTIAKYFSIHSHNA